LSIFRKGGAMGGIAITLG